MSFLESLSLPGGYMNRYLVRACAGAGLEIPMDIKPLDVVFVFDTTDSMYRNLERVRAELSRLTKSLADRLEGVRLGVIAFGDHHDAGRTYLTKVHPLTDQWDRIAQWVQTVEGTQGGDEPEAVEDALWEANRLDWRFNAARAVVLIGDAPPHGISDAKSVCTMRRDWEVETKALAHKSIRVYAVQCGRKKDTRKAFSQMAKATLGKHLFLDQTEDLTDLLIGCCMLEVEEGLLRAFQEELQAAAQLTEGKRSLFAQLTAGTPVGDDA
jgi:hypothetical protein